MNTNKITFKLLFSLMIITSVLVVYHSIVNENLNWYQYILLCMETYLFIFTTYYMILTVFGWKKHKRNYTIQPPSSKFLILVPAHNEEKVISGIINNLKKDINYPKELYDFYILADNCSDDTAKIARELGANVFENKSKKGDPKGKPYAIKAFLEHHRNILDKFDIITIFDSDNIVHFDYFNEINSQFLANNKTNLIQCRVLSKNPSDNYISGGYALSESFMNRFYTIPKQILGLNTTIQGTGFNVRTDYLKRVGWNPKSITEDFEFQVEMSNLNEHSEFNAFAYIYDEKPISPKNSIIQRLRWSRGHWNVAFSNFFHILKSIFQYRTFTQIDTFFYSYNMSRTFMILIGFALSFISLFVYFIFGTGISFLQFYSNPIIVILNLSYNVVLFYVSYREQVKDKSKNNIFYFIWSYVWFTLTYLPLHIVGMITYRRQVWQRTEKFINISLDERLEK